MRSAASRSREKSRRGEDGLFGNGRACFFRRIVGGFAEKGCFRHEKCEKRRRGSKKAFVFTQTAEKYVHSEKIHENLYTFNKTVKNYAIIIRKNVKNKNGAFVARGCFARTVSREAV